MQNETSKRKRRPKPGDLAALRRLLWSCLREAETVADTANPELKLKAGSTVATLAGIYLRALEQTELTRQVEQLRADLQELKQARDAHRYPHAA